MLDFCCLILRRLRQGPLTSGENSWGWGNFRLLGRLTLYSFITTYVVLHYHHLRYLLIVFSLLATEHSVLLAQLNSQASNTAAVQDPAREKMIEVSDMQSWKQIRNETLSANGDYLLYTLTQDVGDPIAVIYDIAAQRERRFPRLHGAILSYDGNYLLGTLKPARDTVIYYKLKKREKELKDMDSLLVYRLGDGEPTIYPNVYDLKLSERSAEIYAYTTTSLLADSLREDLDEDARRLVVRRLGTQDSFFVEGILDYAVARDRPIVVAQRAAKDSTWTDGILRLDPSNVQWQTLSSGPAGYAGLNLDFSGQHVAFLSKEKDDDNQQAPFHLHYWRSEWDTALVVTGRDMDWLPSGYRLSDDRQPSFSAEGDYLYFGTTPRRPELDTNSLASELADVEVWTTEDPRLYTQQNNRLAEEKKFTYLAVYRTEEDDFMQLANVDYPESSRPEEGRGHYVLLYDEKPYLKETTWEGGPAARDAIAVDLRDGSRQGVVTGEAGIYRWSPEGQYVTWYNLVDTAYRSFDLAAGKLNTLTTNTIGTFYDELNDRPMHPYPYGTAGWLADDEAMIVYDRFDLWRLDPSGALQPKRLTRGREAQLRYRYRKLDEEEITLPERMLLTTFSEDNYHGGYGWYSLSEDTFTSLQTGPFVYTDFAKARKAGRYCYSRQDFREFPNLRLTGDLAKAGSAVTDANPQQGEFSWGTAERYQWVDHDGRLLSGLLIKPDGFNPNQQYPLLVNFYERSSEGLYRHRTPVPGRSSINYAHYVSRGYVIFNPDVIYRRGYPGESAYNCVMSGVSSLLSEGYIDRHRIGLQGHSWGGYQAAYLATKTDLFAAIESGAPVVNMFSAYGGIRWGSGRSRQFQYERTQSRIGGSPWEYPLRYLENSPLFFTDKINTPILILHNDQDSAVPWYQGIEWFTALRRLGKPAWMLNYRGEPHWPVKAPNRADFQTRMSQFFDYYLKSEPMPKWMQEGVSPLERGIEQNLELMRD